MQMERRLRLVRHVMEAHKGLIMPWVTPAQAAYIAGVSTARMSQIIKDGQVRSVDILPTTTRREGFGKRPRITMIPLEDVMILAGKVRAGKRGIYGAERKNFAKRSRPKPSEEKTQDHSKR
jgi:hypothetical protein